MFAAASAPSTDPQVVSPPRDTIQSMAWSPKANVLTSGSWDGVVSLFFCFLTNVGVVVFARSFLVVFFFVVCSLLARNGNQPPPNIVVRCAAGKFLLRGPPSPRPSKRIPGLSWMSPGMM
jgi:hypothetical protein